MIKPAFVLLSGEIFYILCFFFNSNKNIDFDLFIIQLIHKLNNKTVLTEEWRHFSSSCIPLKDQMSSYWGQQEALHYTLCCDSLHPCRRSAFPLSAHSIHSPRICCQVKMIQLFLVNVTKTRVKSSQKCLSEGNDRAGNESTLKMTWDELNVLSFFFRTLPCFFLSLFF